MSEDLIKIVLSKLGNIEKKVDETYSRLFISNGNEALIVTVKRNTEKIDNITVEEKGKLIRYITTAGKIAASITAIGSVAVGVALIIVKLI